MSQIPPEPAATLRGMVTGDPEVLEGLLEVQVQNVEESGLGRRVHALVCLGALVALDAPLPSYARQVAAALGAGAGVDDLVGVLVAVAPEVGAVRVAAAAHHVVRALQDAREDVSAVGDLPPLA